VSCCSETQALTAGHMLLPSLCCILVRPQQCCMLAMQLTSTSPSPSRLVGPKRTDVGARPTTATHTHRRHRGHPGRSRPGEGAGGVKQGLTSCTGRRWHRGRRGCGCGCGCWRGCGSWRRGRGRGRGGRGCGSWSWRSNIRCVGGREGTPRAPDDAAGPRATHKRLRSISHQAPCTTTIAAPSAQPGPIAATRPALALP
jgi:hypothetical protein